jgi:hypothetical protein
MWRPGLLLLVVCVFAGCADIPKTSEESYRRSRVVRQPGGGVLVVGPEIPFTARGKRGVTGFQALVKGREVTFYEKTSLGGLEDAGTFETPQRLMETFRRRGSLLEIQGTSVRIFFPPAYIDGFLRRVDSVPR